MIERLKQSIAKPPTKTAARAGSSVSNKRQDALGQPRRPTASTTRSPPKRAGRRNAGIRHSRKAITHDLLRRWQCLPQLEVSSRRLGNLSNYTLGTVPTEEVRGIVAWTESAPVEFEEREY